MGAADIVGLIVAVVGCFVGLAGWLSGREKKIDSNGEWKGSVNTKLDDIKNSVNGISDRMGRMENTIANHETRIVVMEKHIGIDSDK